MLPSVIHNYFCQPGSSYLSLRGVLRSVHAGVVEAAVGAGNLAVLPVGVVEVGHAPAVLLVLVVVGIGRAVLRRSDRLGIGRRRAVVKVDLGSVHLSGAWLQELLAGALAPARPYTDHPDEQHQQDHKEDGARDAAGNVGKLGLLLTLLAGKGAGALAVGLTQLVLQADAVVATKALAGIHTAVRPKAGPIVARPTCAAEGVWRLEQAVGVAVAQLGLALLHLAAVGALAGGHGAQLHRAGVRRTVQALGLLGLRLVLAQRAGLAQVVAGAQELTSHADGEAAVGLTGRASPAGGAALRTVLAAAVDALGAVGAHWAHLTLSIDAQLMAVLAVRPAFVDGERLLGTRGEAHRTQFTRELTLRGLEAAVAAGPAQVCHLVIVAASRALLLALAGAGGPQALCDALNALDCGTLDAGPLGKLGVVLAHRALGADALGLVEEGAGRTRDTLVVHDHLPDVAAEALLEGDGAGVQLGPRQRVIHSLECKIKSFKNNSS